MDSRCVSLSLSLSLSLKLVEGTWLLEIAVRILSFSVSLELVQETSVLEIAVRMNLFFVCLFAAGKRDFRIGDDCYNKELRNVLVVCSMW
jgi:hypothetical protein